MTPERKQELREWAQRAYDHLTGAPSALEDCSDITTECLDEVDRLEARQQELLALTVRLTQEVPLQSEVSEALAQRGRLLAEIGTLRSQLAEQRGPQDIDLDAIGETPDDIEIRSWPRQQGGQQVTRTDSTVIAWHRQTGIAMVVSSERSQHANRQLAVSRLKILLAEATTAWRER